MSRPATSVVSVWAKDRKTTSSPGYLIAGEAEGMDDNSVIRRIVAGAVEDFEQLIERYKRPVFAFVRNMVRDPHSCEDIVQEVFFAAFQHLGHFDPARASFATWLFTIARNRALNELDKAGRRPEPVQVEDLLGINAADRRPLTRHHGPRAQSDRNF